MYERHKMLVQKLEYKSAFFFRNPLPALEVRLTGRTHSSACSLELLHLLQTVKMSKSLFLFSSTRERYSLTCSLLQQVFDREPQSILHHNILWLVISVFWKWEMQTHFHREGLERTGGSSFTISRNSLRLIFFFFSYTSYFVTVPFVPFNICPKACLLALKLFFSESGEFSCHKESHCSMNILIVIVLACCVTHFI